MLSKKQKKSVNKTRRKVNIPIQLFINLKGSKLFDFLYIKNAKKFSFFDIIDDLPQIEINDQINKIVAKRKQKNILI